MLSRDGIADKSRYIVRLPVVVRGGDAVVVRWWYREAGVDWRKSEATEPLDLSGFCGGCSNRESSYPTRWMSSIEVTTATTGAADRERLWNSNKSLSWYRVLLAAPRLLPRDAAYFHASRPTSPTYPRVKWKVVGSHENPRISSGTSFPVRTTFLRLLLQQNRTSKFIGQLLSSRQSREKKTRSFVIGRHCRDTVVYAS